MAKKKILLTSDNKLMTEERAVSRKVQPLVGGACEKHGTFLHEKCPVCHRIEIRSARRSLVGRNGLARYCDLYGFEIIKDALVEGLYSSCSYREKSIPSEGSPCKKTRDLITEGLEAKKAIIHKNGSITFFTNRGVIRFWSDSAALLRMSPND